METIDFDKIIVRRKDGTEDAVIVDNMAEKQRRTLLAARELEAGGERVTTRAICGIMEDEITTVGVQRIACHISALKRKGLWPYGPDGRNGVETTQRLVWPDSAPVPPKAPVAVPAADSTDRTFALDILREFLKLSPAARDRSWPHVRGLVDAVVGGITVSLR